MVTIMDDRALMTRQLCDSRYKEMSDTLNEIKIAVKGLPSEILEKADSLYLRKEEHAVVVKALTDGMLDIKNDLSKTKDKSGDRIWMVLIILAQVLSTIVLGALSLK